MSAKLSKQASIHTGCGATADSIDSFIDLVSLNITVINNAICQLFDLVFQGCVLAPVQCYLTDTYLFCSEKDPSDPTTLCSIGIPSALGRLIAKHVSSDYQWNYCQLTLPLESAEV